MAPRRRVRKVAVYARRSQADEQRRGSVPVQLRQCRELAATEGWEVVAFKDDGQSGWDPNVTREGYGQMLAAIRDGEVDAIVVYKADRLTRQDSERAAFERLYADAGLRMVYLADGTSFDLGTATGRRNFRDAGTYSAYSSDLLSERVQDIVDEIAEGGWWAGGAAPFGYRTVQDGEHKSLAIVEDQAAALREAYQGLINGQPLRALARQLNVAGLHTARGNPWTGGALRRTLMAGRNAGLRERGGEVIGRARWAPIVDRRTWERARGILTAEDRQVFRARGDRYPLTGLVRCSVHGKQMFGRPVGGRRRYSCGSGPDGARMHLGIDAEHLEHHIGDIAMLAVGATTVTVRDPGELPVELLVARDEVDERIRTWNRNAATAGLSADEIRDGRTDLVAERDRVEAELAALATVEEASTEPLWFGEDRWRAWLSLRVDHVNVSPIGRGIGRWTPIGDRVEIVWRQGVRMSTPEEIAEAASKPRRN